YEPRSINDRLKMARHQRVASLWHMPADPNLDPYAMTDADRVNNRGRGNVLNLRSSCPKTGRTSSSNNRGELKLPCGRPLLIGRGEESVLSTLTRNVRSERNHEWT
ncbi:hypothetical protein TNCV_4869141, partial [Trichonephila clavipes]